MIGWLRGPVVAFGTDGDLIVDAGGVGYQVSVPAPLLASLGTPGETVELHVHTHVREDAIVLFGFESPDDRRVFEALLSAHGVGPSLALAVLSALRAGAVVRAVLEEDVETLCTVPGIGRKTAARLVIDLKAKLAIPDLAGAGPAGGSRGTGGRAEVRAALAELGYGPEEIRRALEGIGADEGDRSVEDLLRGALRELAAVR